MITSIPSLSIKKGIKSPNKRNNVLNSQDFFQTNDKSITTNESYTILTEKKIKSNKSKNINQIKTINSNIEKNTRNLKNSKSNKINNLINFKNIISLNNINNIENIKKSMSPNKSNINPVLSPRIINLVNNMQPYSNNKTKSPKSIPILPKISKKILLTEADTLVKERKRHNGLLDPHVAANIKIKKSGEINLKNYIIRRIKEKREEIQKKENKITEDFKNKQNIYDKRYKNFLGFIEQNQKKQKEEENELNILKSEIDNQEKILNKEKIKNKKLVDELKIIINSIVSFTKYGSFVHKIFGRKFIYEELKEFDGKDYFKMMFRFIDAYDKYIQDKILQKEENEFLDMLFSHGVIFLNMQFSDMEENLRKVLDRKNIINEEIEHLNHKNKNEINLLIYKKKENENYKIIFNNDKNKQNALIKSFEEYNDEQPKRFLKYIIEFWDILVGNKNKKKKIIKNIEINEDTMLYSNDVLKALEEKEYLINKYINEIENIFKNEDNKDKMLIEKIIYDRNKIDYKQKQAEIRKIQEENEIKKKFKTIEEKIVIKGRKVIQDFPLIKNNKKKKKIVLRKNNDDYDDYLYYSSDEN